MAAVTTSTKFKALLSTSLADKKVDKLEARKLRKQALADLKAAPKKAPLMGKLSDTFGSLKAKAKDKPSLNYLESVREEMDVRERHQRAGDGLVKYLKTAKNLPALLKNVDVKEPFEVGTTMQRGVWLRVEIKDRSKYYETTAAVEKLFAKNGPLEKFAPIWVIA